MKSGRSLWRRALAGIAASTLAACAQPMGPESEADPGHSSSDRIDPAIYFRTDDPSDPYRALYADFRARRARDMADASLPELPARYPAVHVTREQPWGAIQQVLPFDWAGLRAVASLEIAQLEAATRVRLAFDHPDLKIVQLMLGPGALLPSHADGSPGVLIVVGGRGEITVAGRTQTATPGTTAKLHPYDVRRLQAGVESPLRVLWIRWAPGGDQAFIDAGYYLTGSNQHIQPLQADLPPDYLFWDASYETRPLAAPSRPVVRAPADSPYTAASRALSRAREALGDERELYPDVPVFRHESEIPWLTLEMIEKAGFFFSKDVAQMGAVVERMSQITKHKAIFRAVRADGRWDFNISQTAWGPRSTYVEHSHLVPEFYYVLSGPVIYGIDGERRRVMPGDIILNNSYAPHLAQGIVDGMPFDNFGSTWAPQGDRGVFARPFFLVEPLPEQPASARLPEAVAFHP